MTEEKVKECIANMKPADKTKLAIQAGLKGVNIETQLIPYVANLTTGIEVVINPVIDNIKYINSLDKGVRH
jgi:hypothetical protein